MANVFDVAAYILEKLPGETSIWKLQKLVYYCQAWHCVWEDKPLFNEKIEAWFAGPVAPELYCAHKGKYNISRYDLKGGDSSHLTADEKDSIDVIINDYGHFSGSELSLMTHDEVPWINARGNAGPGMPCRNEITHQSMRDYYSSLG